MVLSAEEGKARRLAGMKRANLEMTAVQRIHRALINGRPPASELKTPHAAVTAARVLHRELETRLTVEGVEPTPGECAVSIGYVTPDLSVVGFTPPYAPGEETGLMTMLTGNVMIGLVFGVVDKEAKDDEGRILMGARPFLTTKQTEGWLSELFLPVRSRIEHSLL
jgi:hypothetical protein